MINLHKNKFSIGIAIALIVALLFFSLSLFGFFSSWQTSLSNVLYTEQPALQDIVIIAVDDKSLQELGVWPWNRENFASVLNELSEAKVIAIDVAFYKESNASADSALANAISERDVILPVEYADFSVSSGKAVARKILKPIPILEDVAQLGFVNIFTDKDGITRSIPLTIESEAGENYNSFTAEIYKQYLGKEFSYDKEKLTINFAGLGSFKT